MAISPVAGTEQEVTDNAGTSTILDVQPGGPGTRPTAGNLLVVRFVGDSILSGISDDGTGSWTLIPAAYDGGFTDHRIAYKIAAGDESAITLETGNDTDRCIHYQEYEGNETTGVLDVSANASSGTGTGTTGTTSQADTYACALRSNSGGPTTGFSGWTNSFTEVADLIQGAVGLGSADLVLTSTQTVTTSADEDGADAGGVVAVFLAAAGAGTVNGSADLTFGALSLTAIGKRVVHGSAAITLGALTVAATGRRTVHGSASLSLGGLSLTATGRRTVHGSATIALGGLTLMALGEVVGVTEGTADLSLGALSLTATGKRVVYGSAQLQLGGLNLTAVGQVEGVTVGTAELALGGLTLTATGKRVVHGTATVSFGGLTLTANQLPLVTPASRTFTVQAEDRTFSVLAEDRTFQIAAESRRFAVT